MGLYAAGLGERAEPVALALDSVPFAACPGGGTLGELHRGDRVLATARDESGDWFQVRDPRDLDARVWVRAPYVVPDEDVADLPVAGCEDRGTVAFGAAPTSTTTTTTTTVPGSTTTTAPGDTTPPDIGTITATPTTIYDSPCSLATTSVVRVSVTDTAGVAEVRIAWAIQSGPAGSKLASLVSGEYQATIGPFPAPVGPTLPKPVGLTVTAKDAFGNTKSKAAPASTLTLNSCFE